MPLAILEQIHQRAKAAKKRIGLADATDPRMLEAARIASDEGIAEIFLIGSAAAILESARTAGLPTPSCTIFESAEFPKLELLIDTLMARVPSLPDRSEVRLTIEKNDLLFGALLVSSGEIEGLLAGSLSTTGDVIRAGLRGIGLAEDRNILSSMFLMAFPKIQGMREEYVLGFGDCAVIPDPSAEQLADIAIATSTTYKTLTGNSAKTALLSFSTKGSAGTPSTEKVIQAYKRLEHSSSPGFVFDGELQFDTAFVPAVAAKKSPGSPLEGKANVFIFPNLDAGNIGYKIAERIGMGQAIGPILQGLAKPMNDLSRGTSVSEIVTMIAITALQSA
jgi:phosphate acetyltransferase